MQGILPPSMTRSAETTADPLPMPEASQEAPPETLDPTPPPPPRPTARTVEEFDTTTAEDRAEALDVEPEAQERLLGTTIGSLGSPTDPGIWIKTPLVQSLTEGRVEVVSTGKTANIELRPSGGDVGSGSQLSLAAMRLLEVPLTDLPELKIYAK